LSTTEAAYLAAMVDGEGYIHINPKGRRIIRVSVANTSAELMDWLRSIGGYVTSNRHSYSPERKSQKIVYAWHTSSWRTCANVLRQILPYMIIKTAKANTAIDLLYMWLGQPKKARKTHCALGHEFTPDNTSIDRDGAQRCKACTRRRTAVYRERRHLRIPAESDEYRE
jgi:hypothetical protein